MLLNVVRGSTTSPAQSVSLVVLLTKTSRTLRHFDILILKWTKEFAINSKVTFTEIVPRYEQALAVRNKLFESNEIRDRKQYKIWRDSNRQQPPAPRPPNTQSTYMGDSIYPFLVSLNSKGNRKTLKKDKNSSAQLLLIQITVKTITQ